MNKKERERYYGRFDQFKVFPPRGWSLHEELYLIENAEELTNFQLAVKLDRTVKAIERKKSELRKCNRLNTV